MKDINFKCFDEGYLKVSVIHQIYYCQYGNPKKEPILWLHGGPGSGCQYDEPKYFDLTYFRVILFDQRGAGKSLPFCELTDNTTHYLVSDIELLINHLGIKKWSVVGGSWGTLLALCYAIEYPENLKAILLRGVFLGSKDESVNIWHGMRDTFPEAWDEFYSFLPQEEKKEFVQAYRTRILSTNEGISLPAIDSFYKYDCICSWHKILNLELQSCLSDMTAKVGCSKLFCYYDAKRYFIYPDYILKNLYRIQHLR